MEIKRIWKFGHCGNENSYLNIYLNVGSWAFEIKNTPTKKWEKRIFIECTLFVHVYNLLQGITLYIFFFCKRVCLTKLIELQKHTFTQFKARWKPMRPFFQEQPWQWDTLTSPSITSYGYFSSLVYLPQDDPLTFSKKKSYFYILWKSVIICLLVKTP